MTATKPAPPPTEVLEVYKPGSGEVVRIGPTVTQVAGFGPQAEVVSWLANAMVVAPLVIGADAFDDLNDSHRHSDHLEPADRQVLVDRVLELAEQARDIEDTLQSMATLDPEALDEHVEAALALADEWEAFAPAPADAHRPEVASREIALRARTTQVFGCQPDGQPADALRDYAAELMRRRPNPDAAVALRSELDRIEAEGRDLVDRIDAADGIALPAVRIQEMFGRGAEPVIVDGNLLYAVAPVVHDMLLDKLRAEADRRRIVIVFDDTLDAWLSTVHGASLWTTGHLHLVHDPAEDAKPHDLAGRRAKAHAERAGKAVTACEKHPSQLTRLVCSACERPFCSACLVRVRTKHALLCVECALARGTGVRRPRR